MWIIKVKFEFWACVRKNIVQSHVSEISNRSDARIVQIGLIKAADELLILAKITDFCEVGVIEVSATFQLHNTKWWLHWSDDDAYLILKGPTNVWSGRIPQNRIIVPFLQSEKPDKSPNNNNANSIHQERVVSDDKADSDVVSLYDTNNACDTGYDEGDRQYDTSCRFSEQRPKGNTDGGLTSKVRIR